MKPKIIGPSCRTASGTPSLRGVVGLSVLAGVLCILNGCAARTTTADTVWRDQQIARQQAEQKPQTPNDRGLYLSLIVQMQSKGLYFASLAHIDAFEKKFGTAGDIALLRADALRETGQPDLAIAVYQAWAKGDTEAAAEHGIGRAMAARHDRAGAMVALQRAVELDPTNVSYLNDLAYVRMLNGDIAGARIPVAQAAELAAENPKVIANLALYLMLSGQPTQADTVMQRAKMSPEAQQTTRAMAASMASTRDRAAGGVPTAQAGQADVARVDDDGTDGAVQADAVRAAAADPENSAIRRDALAWQGGSVLQRFAQTR
ncbi:tetratricopeptide repeat protein [Robbsia sp. KACC 23696]|uniref:tetratricopeptide repeat protein n=1 Tax=Robbsia sp. KACC 23696 TaxID=3149231 RepID=UPI00325B3CA6